MFGLEDMFVLYCADGVVDDWLMYWVSIETVQDGYGRILEDNKTEQKLLQMTRREEETGKK